MRPLYSTLLQLFVLLLLGVDAQVQIFDTSIELEARDFSSSGSDISWENINNVGNGDPETYASSKQTVLTGLLTKTKAITSNTWSLSLPPTGPRYKVLGVELLLLCSSSSDVHVRGVTFTSGLKVASSKEKAIVANDLGQNPPIITTSLGGPTDLWDANWALEDFQGTFSVSMYFDFGGIIPSKEVRLWKVSLRVHLGVFMSISQVIPSSGFFPNGRNLLEPGLQVITIEGTNLWTNNGVLTLDVRLGTNYCQNPIATVSQIKCQTPTVDAIGEVDVKVSIGGFQSAEQVTFTYRVPCPGDPAICSGKGECGENGNCSCFETSLSPDCAPPFSDIASSEGLAIELIIGVVVGGAVLCILAVALLAFFIVRRKRHSRRIKFQRPNWNEFAYGKWRELQYHSLPNNYNGSVAPLSQLLGQPEALATISKSVPDTESDYFARAVIHGILGTGLGTDLVCAVMDHEIEAAKDQPTTFFRGNTTATKLFQAYSKIVGLEYLWELLGQFLTDLDHEEDEIEDGEDNAYASSISYEIDPLKLSEDQKEFLSLNKYNLMVAAQSLLLRIFQSGDSIPPELRKICQHVSQQVDPEFRFSSIGGLLFLRFIVPAIITPHIYGLYQNPPRTETQRKLVLLAKVLQNLANGTTFGGKEEYMQRMSDLVVENKEKMENFFQKITQDVPPFSSDIKPPPAVVTNSLASFHALSQLPELKSLPHFATLSLPKAPTLVK